MFFIIFLSSFCFNINASIINKILTELKQNSPFFKDIEYKFYSSNELHKLVYAKYSYQAFLDANYSKQDGRITGNFFIDNSENSILNFGIKKSFPYGLNFEFNHTYNNNSLTSSVLGFSNQAIYFPVTSISLKADLLKNFIGSQDKLEINSSTLKQDRNNLSLSANINTFYLNVLVNFLKTKALKDQIHVAKTLLDSSNTLLKVINRKYSIGTTEKRNKIFAESNKIESEAALLSTNRAYVVSLYNLNSFSGIDLSSFFDEEIHYEYIKSTLNKLAFYNTNNLETKMLDLELKITENELKYNSRSTLPDLSLLTSYSFGGFSNKLSDSYNSFPNRASFIGFSLLWDIENTGPKLTENSSRLYLESIKQSLIYNNFSLDNELNALRETVVSYEAQLVYAKNKLDKNKIRYDLELKAFDLGRSSFTELIDAQRSLAYSEAELNNIKYELLISIINTAYKKGVLSELFEVE